MSTDITLTAPSPTKMALVTLSILVGLALLYPAWLALRTGMDSPSFLPEPTAVQTPYHQSASPHELVLFTATALQPAYNNRESYQVPLEYGDHRKFKGHLAHISARNGWFLYHSGRTLFKVVVPRSQIDRLKNIETDPLGWVHNQIHNPPVPREPTAVQSQANLLQSDPVQVTIRLRSNSLYELKWALITTALLLPALAFIAIPIWLLHNQAQTRSRQQT